MKNLFLKSAAAVMLLVGMFLASCYKESVNQLADSKEYSTLDFEAYATSVEQVLNPDVAEVYASRLYDFKEDENGLLKSEVYSLGDPAKNHNLLVALKLVEVADRDEVLWSSEEKAIDEAAAKENRAIVGTEPISQASDRVSKYQWTGGASQFSLFCSGWKKWPAKYNMLFVGACHSFYYNGGYVCRSTLTCSPFPPN